MPPLPVVRVKGRKKPRIERIAGHIAHALDDRPQRGKVVGPLGRWCLAAHQIGVPLERHDRNTAQRRNMRNELLAERTVALPAGIVGHPV